MSRIILFIALIGFAFSCQPFEKNETSKIDYALVIHGGAGNLTLENVNRESREAYESKLEEALNRGLELLSNDSGSVAVVETVIRVLEDSPLFNAGKGAVFTHYGTNELDASIMEGTTLNAGAVAGVSDIKNPIMAARKVMEISDHVLLSAEGASLFAEENSLEIVDPSYFFTEDRFNSLMRVLEREGIDTDSLKASKYGTVGCVALDKKGTICAGTSTGGMTHKKYGRIGDSPIIGAGTYAKNSTCGISATGHGEYFIRYAVAHEISALMEHRGMNLQEAASSVIHDVLKPAGGDGGVIGLDARGNYAMEFNTPGMLRAYANSEGEKMIAIFREGEE